MCGIGGLIRPREGAARIGSALDRMWNGVASRGPDGRGQFARDGIGLIHSRLAIIDLVTGEQPIWNEDHTIACVFNGEIYNYRPIRAELLRRGHSLSTTTDTEVLVHLYEDHGEDLVNHIHGMYAFAIYDAVRRRVVLARDPLGIKPLFVSRTADGLAFSSSIRSLIDAGASAAPDFTALAEYVRYLKVPEPRTAYAAIRALLPGNCSVVDVDSAAATTRRFWTPPIAKAASRHPQELEEHARQSLTEAVRSHLVADVEVAAFLSGGIDSSLVVAQAQQLSSKPLRTYCAAFGMHPVYDEARFAEQVARVIGTNHQTVQIDAAAPDLVRKALRAAEQPFAVASFLPLLLLCERASRDVKVILTGDGGDEIGFGYPWYNWARVAARLPATLRWDSAAFRRLERISSRSAHLRPLRRATRFARGALRGGAHGADAWRFDLDQEECVDLLRGEHRAGVRPASPTASVWREDVSEPDALRLADLCVHLRDEMLPKVDRAGMAFGLEGRVPLLDDGFVEAMLALPSSSHQTGSKGKLLLRKWAREMVPGLEVDRPKHGFDVPIHEWLRTSLSSEVERLLFRPRSRGIFEPAAIQAVWRRAQGGVPGAAHTVYAALVAELWYEESVA
jgi:asparagine synthase (glutamine-hydrolysing)